MVTLVGIFNLGPFGAGLAYNDPDDGKNQTQFVWVESNGTLLTGSYAGSELRFGFAESVVVPEPSSTLSLIVFGTLGVGSSIFCKKREKSAEKQPEKAV